MKNKAKILALLVMGMLAGTELFAQQCTPDPDCVDNDDKPGQFCPLDLPDGVINVLYDEKITVIPPGTFKIPGFDLELTILYIQIDSVLDLPTGIEYFPSEDTLYPGTSYCIQLTGTPTQVGNDTLDIYISATADVFGTPTKAQVMDDTSIMITIKETVGIAPNEETGFQVFQNVPNPFSELTRLDYYVPYNDRIELNVYNVLGVLVHHESVVVPTGTHSFGFDGKGLQPGTYFYRVAYGETSVSGKLVKSR
jgi:hypothetical protein